MIKAFFKNSFIYTFGTVLTKGMSLLLVPIYTRYLSPSEYGIIDLFVIVASIISLTIALEIHQAVVRFYQDTKEQKDRTEYVSTAFLFTVFVYSLFLIVSLTFSDNLTVWLLDDLAYKGTYLLATWAIFTQGLFYFTHGQLKWQIMPKESTVVSIINALIVALVAVYLLVVENMKIESIFIGQIVGNTMGIFISIYYTRRSYQLTFVYVKFKEMVSFSLPLVLSGVAIFIALFIDRIAIKYFLGLEDLGIYGLAYRFASITSLVMIGFQSSLTPLIYKHYKEKETPENIAKLFKLFSIFALFVITGTILFSNEMITFLTTKEYYQASPIIPILVMAIFFTNMYIFLPGLSIAKKTKIISLISILGAIFNTVLNFIFIPKFGVEGAAYATLVSAISISIIRTIMSNKYYYIPITWKKSIFAFILTIISAKLIDALFDDISFFNIVLKTIFLIIVTLITTRMLLGQNTLLLKHKGNEK